MDTLPIKNNFETYETGNGDSLAIEDSLTPTLIEYVKEESAIIDSVLQSFDCLIEIGCMWGRHCKSAIGASKPYFGIDYCQRYIKQAKQNHSNFANCGFICEDASSLSLDDFRSLYVGASVSRPLTIIPFNCIGNMEDPAKMLRVLQEWGGAFLIFAYQDSVTALGLLREYFAQSGFPDLSIRESSDRIVFDHPGGFRSNLLRDCWFQMHCRGIECADRSNLLRYWSFNLANLG